MSLGSFSALYPCIPREERPTILICPLLSLRTQSSRLVRLVLPTTSVLLHTDELLAFDTVTFMLCVCCRGKSSKEPEGDRPAPREAYPPQT
jgi:hypothetical protein